MLILYQKNNLLSNTNIKTGEIIVMPIYEYECLDPNKGCQKCINRFEAIQAINEKPLATCPSCGQRVKKIISWCQGTIGESSGESNAILKRIKGFESQGQWGHAGELADRQSEKTNNKSLKDRALDNYKKGGYNTDWHEKQ